MSDQIITINHRELNLTNLDKILYSHDHISKQDLITYYQKIASYMLPYLHNRPLSLLRFPDGIEGAKFFQKNMPDYFPAWIKHVSVALKSIDKINRYMVCNNLETLVYLANYVCVPHIWLSYYDKLDYPNKMIFDLDPADHKDFNQVRLLALELHDFFKTIGLSAFAMLTGSSGMHVVVPIKRTKNFDEVRAFAKSIAQVIVKKNPDLYTLEANLAKRNGRIFIDILRNGFGATSITPYAVRDKIGAPVATPISWQEAQDAQLNSQRYNLNNIFTYLEHHHNPWADFEKLAVTLTEPIKKLKKLNYFF